MIATVAMLLVQAAQPVELSAALPVSYPHPLITEVLYAVPTGAAGDANGDGSRDVNGDEFIEMVNPHDKPIQLAGYVLADRELEKNGKKFTSMRFKFPALELKPGEVVVVFNGHGQKWTGPVGNSREAPASGHEKFGGARVLSMEVGTSNVGLANKGDCVQLIAPDGLVAQCITWGDAPAPTGAARVETAPTVSKSSVQRASTAGPFEAHAADGKAFSPGVWRDRNASSESKSEVSRTETKPQPK